MLHWTLLPDELIYGEMKGQDDSLSFHETIYEGVPLLVQQAGKGIKVVRILSPDPTHFLDPRFQPGNVLFFSSNS
jgi:hypothetical protein